MLVVGRGFWLCVISGKVPIFFSYFYHTHTHPPFSETVETAKEIQINLLPTIQQTSQPTSVETNTMRRFWLCVISGKVPIFFSYFYHTHTHPPFSETVETAKEIKKLTSCLPTNKPVNQPVLKQIQCVGSGCALFRAKYQSFFSYFYHTHTHPPFSETVETAKEIKINLLPTIQQTSQPTSVETNTMRRFWLCVISGKVPIFFSYFYHTHTHPPFSETVETAKEIQINLLPTIQQTSQPTSVETNTMRRFWLCVISGKVPIFFSYFYHTHTHPPFSETVETAKEIQINLLPTNQQTSQPTSVETNTMRRFWLCVISGKVPIFFSYFYHTHTHPPFSETVETVKEIKLTSCLPTNKPVNQPVLQQTQCGWLPSVVIDLPLSPSFCRTSSQFLTFSFTFLGFETTYSKDPSSVTGLCLSAFKLV